MDHEEENCGSTIPWPLSAGFCPGPGLDDMAHDGFCRFDEFVSQSHLNALRLAFDARMKQSDDGEVELGCQWADAQFAPFVQILLDERLLDWLGIICGLPLVAVRLELFVKHPNSDTAIPWHQDTYTTHSGYCWSKESAAAGEQPHPVTLWIPLDDVCCQNGGMEMIPGRHRELLNAKNGAIPESLLEGDPRVEYSMAAGQAGVHHPLVPHRSCSNQTAGQRRAFLYRFSPWTTKLEQQCTAKHSIDESWPHWRSKPSGKYTWHPGNEEALAGCKKLNRLLVCHRS
eukprot:gnl/MRDRNA2_/MRDRNA2_127205_c0_seq1.p1 gnl/MRDRNA2_/MRDRNA2_127205_c0~~gnl/MRDRNA2_/MRDRNA2_127205_c0_seq1.p1  ORF type:complete len:299 (-),score=53.38 gnl/MRDRNA2_/MRDRNA2_127205_c0_seq1:121-978(-)